MQNIKVDVIYYKAPTDFELEFNLCGCCRMRMLTDKASDRRSFVHSLSRAVSRSRIIICSGPLFEEEGLINSVALAIGRGLETVDNAAFNIKGANAVSVIKGSMPLVTADGIFGGCIIESGPQSIILLTESRSVRKALMTSLIHPYIEELSVTRSAVSEREAEPEPRTEPENEAESAAEEEEINDAALEAVEETLNSESEITQPEEAQPEAETVTVAAEAPESNEQAEAMPDAATAREIDEPDNEAAVEPERSEPISEEPIKLSTEPQEEDTENKFIAASTEISDENSYVTDDGDDDIPPRRSLRLPIVIITVVLLAAILLLVYLLVFEPMSSGISPAEYLGSLFKTASYVKPAWY